MNLYIDIPRAAIEDRLKSCGFTRDDVRGEVTYSRVHDRDSRYRVKVYTSIPEFDTVSRSCGEDAIRVVALLTWTRRDEDVPRHKKLYQARIYRVNSVDGVLDRMVERMRDAYAAINEFRLQKK